MGDGGGCIAKGVCFLRRRGQKKDDVVEKEMKGKKKWGEFLSLKNYVRVIGER